jgi:F0F1-type ATP synthase membrane subunit c/vacuolar-type H+-ATPase subunit K
VQHGCPPPRPDRQEYVELQTLRYEYRDTLHRVACVIIPLTGNLDIVPIVMAGIIGIYGLVVSVLVANDLQQQLPLYTGFIQLGAGLAVGLAGLAAG